MNYVKKLLQILSRKLLQIFAEIIGCLLDFLVKKWSTGGETCIIQDCRKFNRLRKTRWLCHNVIKDNAIVCEKTRLNTNFSMSTDTFLPPPFSAIFEDLLLSVKVQPSKFDPPMLSKVSVTFLIKSFPVNSKEILSMDSKDSSSSWHETMSNGYQKKFIAHLYFCRIRRTVRKVPVSYKCKHILVKQKKAPK